MYTLVRSVGSAGTGRPGSYRVGEANRGAREVPPFRKINLCEWYEYPEEVLTKSESDMYRYGAGFRHPCKWYEYCRRCGDPCIIKFGDTKRIEPVGIIWRSRGWHCEVCAGEVWRVANELYSALFLRQVPTGFYMFHEVVSLKWRPDQPTPLRLKQQSIHSRVVKHCLWCKGRMMDDGRRWNLMICEDCKDNLEGMVKGWLSKEVNLPSVIADQITGFVFD